MSRSGMQHFVPRNEREAHALLAGSVRDRFDSMTRGQLLAYCISVDRNGCWTDEQCEIERMAPATRDELLNIVRTWERENLYVPGRTASEVSK